MLPVSIETLRVRVGLDSADTSRDDDINMASDTALALMGNYCDRRFDQVEDFVEEFTHIDSLHISLIRYPVVTIASLVDDSGGSFTDYHLAAQRGVINLDRYQAFHQLTVTYTGGYAQDEFPADLLAAYYAVFDQEWATIDGTASVDSISSVTVSDVGTVRFRDDSRYFHDESVAYLPLSVAAILDGYKRYKC